MMRAIVGENYGPADNLKLKEVPRPIPGEGEILIKVYASSVNAGDWHVMRGDPFVIRFLFGLFHPKIKILGTDIAGVVESIGKGVTQFKPGDEVFGDVTNHSFGGFGEYTLSNESQIYTKPTNLTFQEAAALPVTAVTALQGLRDHAKVKAGQKVLVVGAAGGVGTCAVQIAKAKGATVTGVCSTKNVELVRSLGADNVIDYTKQDYTKMDEQYDVIFDVAATKSLFSIKHALADKGIYVNGGGDTMFHTIFWGPILSMFGSKKYKMFFAATTQSDLKEIKEMVEAGKIRPEIEKVYPLSKVPDAIKHVESKRARGKNVIDNLNVH
jgi:NADPH:quinone reductase-like Zn-dependent oxidoreductase